MKKPFGRWFRQYMNFSKKDRNAIIVLGILMLFFLTVNILIDFVKVNSDFDYSEFEMALNNLDKNQISQNLDSRSLFEFDPNTISAEKLDSLLLPGHIKKNLLNYRNAGGKIKDSDDFRKIYGMNDSIFEAVQKYIVVPKQTSQFLDTEKVAKYEYKNEPGRDHLAERVAKTPPLVVLDLNTADSVDLVNLSGIGPAFASRILKYRDLLGGFYSTEQLLEVYNFPEETYNNLVNYLSADTLTINRIRINFAEFAELLRHPYLNKKQVEDILEFRGKNGAFHSGEQLYSANLLDSVTFFKIKPYVNCR